MVLATACGGAQIPADARVTVVSLERIDCADCGARVVDELRRSPGVYAASFDRRRAEVRVTASPGFDVFTRVRTLAANEGFSAILGAGKGRYVEPPAFPPGADVQVVVKDGSAVPPSLDAIAVKGKVTVVDFGAAWCRPCREVDEHMASVLGGRADVAYRKLDIGDWDSPVAQRYLKTVAKLPYVVVYGKSGARVAALTGLDLARLDAAIAEGAAR
ncbi:MAG TPA: thioredoxin family protein [Minicystis sp.]|nr:thioredoxin family protein [Minicystis sp.]